MNQNYISYQNEENNTRKDLGSTATTVAFALVIIAIVGFIAGYIVKEIARPLYLETKQEFVRYDNMQVVQDDKYLLVYEVTSNVPSNNYTIGKVCVDNQILTVQGKVNVIYITEGKPYCEYRKSYLRNNDKLNVYTYVNTVDYKFGQSSGTR